MATTSLARSGLTTFQKYSSLLAGNEAYNPGNYEFLTTTVLGSNQSTVTLSGLDAYATDYQHLQLRISVKAGAGDPYTDRLRIMVNGSDANLRRHGLYTNGSTVGSYAGSPYGGSLVLSDRLDNANYTAIVMDILDPFEVKNKTIRSLVGTVHAVSGESIVDLASTGYFSTSVISSITFGVGNTSMSSSVAANSRFSIYGIRVGA